MRKEHESMKASYFYKADSLEKELQKLVTKKANLKAKVLKIRAVLEALNQMVQNGVKDQEDPSDYEEDGVNNTEDLIKQAKGLAPPKRDENRHSY